MPKPSILEYPKVKIQYQTGKIPANFPLQFNQTIENIGLDAFIRTYIDNTYLNESDILNLFGETIYNRFLELNPTNLKLEKKPKFLDILEQKLKTKQISKNEYLAQKAEYLELLKDYD